MNESPVKRPVGMTILLVLSLINAIFQIFSSFGMWLTTPMLSQMMADGTLEETITPFLTLMQMDNEELKAFWEVMEMRLSISRHFYLITALLYVGSLVGVIQLFKLQRTGFHCYGISQMLILIVAVIFIYSKQGSVGFINDFLMTAMFILIYHLYLKRIENDPKAQKEQDF